MDESQKAKYEEAGRYHRYILNWRYGAFAGYFAILYGIASLSFELWDEHPERAALIWILASPIGVALFAADRRTRRLYGAAQDAAKSIAAGNSGELYESLIALGSS